LIVDVHHQVTSLLRDPLPRRVSRDPGQVHAAGAVLNDEQHLQAAREHGIDMEEIGRKDRLRLSVQKRLPSLPGPPGRGIDADVPEDPPHRRWRELVPRPASSPWMRRYPQAQLIPGHLQNQRPHDDQAQLAELTAGQQPG
jgi:hypothetical protein